VAIRIPKDMASLNSDLCYFKWNRSSSVRSKE